MGYKFWRKNFLNSNIEYTSEVNGLDVNEVNKNIFATGSDDTTIKIWKIREKKKCVVTFQSNYSSMNCVIFFPGRLSIIAAGSEDYTLKELYDSSAIREFELFKKEENDNNSINSNRFS